MGWCAGQKEGLWPHLHSELLSCSLGTAEKQVEVAFSQPFNTATVNMAKQYQPTQTRVFGASNFLACPSNLQSLNQKPCNEQVICTSPDTSRAFSVHAYQRKNLIHRFSYFDECQKPSNVSVSTRVLCKKLGHGPACGWQHDGGDRKPNKLGNKGADSLLIY